ncbi:hypothetical protein BC940DRAFT_337421 [Gongronella butleri]|nr:hypothetical protein BC940DRAFT_337421 [Gongronella butleri]
MLDDQDMMEDEQKLVKARRISAEEAELIQFDKDWPPLPPSPTPAKTTASTSKGKGRMVAVAAPTDASPAAPAGSASPMDPTAARSNAVPSSPARDVRHMEQELEIALRISAEEAAAAKAAETHDRDIPAPTREMEKGRLFNTGAGPSTSDVPETSVAASTSATSSTSAPPSASMATSGGRLDDVKRKTSDTDVDKVWKSFGMASSAIHDVDWPKAEIFIGDVNENDRA